VTATLWLLSIAASLGCFAPIVRLSDASRDTLPGNRRPERRHRSTASTLANRAPPPRADDRRRRATTLDLVIVDRLGWLREDLTRGYVRAGPVLHAAEGFWTRTGIRVRPQMVYKRRRASDAEVVR
jgi:hypothetical protein